jgi:hypothetical protein
MFSTCSCCPILTKIGIFAKILNIKIRESPISGFGVVTRGQIDMSNPIRAYLKMLVENERNKLINQF